MDDPAFADLTFPYRLPPGLRDRASQEDGRLYPMLLIQLSKPGERPLSFEGLVDSGADTLFIPKRVAEILGLELHDMNVSAGVFEKGICHRSKVGLIIGRMGAGRLDFGQVDATVPESYGDIPILIGRDPFFKYFEVCFKEYRDKPVLNIVQKKPLPVSGEDGSIMSIS